MGRSVTAPALLIGGDKMQIVIDIPKDTHERITKPDKLFSYDDVCKVLLAVYRGIVLPKHGPLVDADTLWDAYHNLDYDFMEALDVVPMILEASKK